MRQKRKCPLQPANSRFKPYIPPRYTHPAVFLLWTHLYPTLCYNVLREIAEYYPKPVFLAGISRHRLYLVDVFSYMALSVPVKIKEHRLFQLDEGHILCAGDNLQCRHMYLVHYFPITVAKLPEMQQWSQLRAYAYHRAYIYVFQDLYTDSEKYSVSAGQWSVLPSRVLQRKPDFTVVWKEQCWMYTGHGQFVQFDFSTEEVRTCRLKTEIPWCCLAAIMPGSEGKVLVICECCEMRIVKLGELTERTVGSPVHPWRWPRTYGFTVLTGNSLYWLEAKSLDIHFLSLDTMDKSAIRWVPIAPLC